MSIYTHFEPIERTWNKTPVKYRTIAARLALRMEAAKVAWLFNVAESTVNGWKREYARNGCFHNKIVKI